jgi:hypothetical protein
MVICRPMPDRGWLAAGRSLALEAFSGGSGRDDHIEEGRQDYTGYRGQHPRRNAVVALAVAAQVSADPLAAALGTGAHRFFERTLRRIVSAGL